MVTNIKILKILKSCFSELPVIAHDVIDKKAFETDNPVIKLLAGDGGEN
ncbi:2524_t:CDS:2 [Funneliformis mosseae]|uniref:2524_t:CDS:1 n=1 Tax=Funneliformis mosseae TaxID=27381 RepID=A0A9N9DKZ9_FUNMO|nr:2524_t:CDS:2 [Funneliformis mosseae]